jgi:pyruvate kinase
VGLLAGGAIELVPGSAVRITTDPIPEGNAERFSCTYEKLAEDLSPGNRILLDDGLLELRVVESDKQHEIKAEVVRVGPLRQKKGINLPGARLSTPAMTEKDKDDLAFGLELGVDYVAMSFVRQAKDLMMLRQIITDSGKPAPHVVAKIERPEALDHLDAIIGACHAIMIARGDLGVETPIERVPLLQKEIIRRARAQGRPVITATQMLESMTEHRLPTRAEVSDVANAILDGTDAVMLSGETAAGRYPVEAVATMARIAEIADWESAKSVRVPADLSTVEVLPEVVGEAVELLVRRLSAKLVIAATESGRTARYLASSRPPALILGYTPNPRAVARMALYRGVWPVLGRQESSDWSSVVTEVCQHAEARGLVIQGDYVVLVAGTRFGPGGIPNMIQVHRVGDQPKK